MERDLIERYEAACELSKEVSELKEELRKEILAAAASEVRPESLPRKTFGISKEFYEKTGITIDELLEKSFPGWEVEAEAAFPQDNPQAYGYSLKRSAKYGRYSQSWDDLTVDVTSAESSPEIDWDSLEKEYPEMVDKIGVPEVVYRLDEARLEAENAKNPYLPDILARHVKVKVPVMRVKVKRNNENSSNRPTK